MRSNGGANSVRSKLGLHMMELLSGHEAHYSERPGNNLHHLGIFIVHKNIVHMGIFVFHLQEKYSHCGQKPNLRTHEWQNTTLATTVGNSI